MKVFLIPVLIFLALLTLHIHNISLYPYDRGPDAPHHIDYITYLKEHKKVPLPNEGWELYQPPLYYTIGAIVGTLPLLKSIHIVLWIILVIITYKFFYLLEKNNSIALTTTMLVMTTPVITYAVTLIGNEFFSAAVISFALMYYLTHQSLKTTKEKVLLAIILGLSLLAKATAVLLVASICLDVLIQNRFQIKKIVHVLALPLFIASIIGGWFYMRNLILFGNPFVSSIDFPQWAFTERPWDRSIWFFTNITSILTLDLFKAHHYSLIGGTFFSWVYDGHNFITPVQQFSKIGALLVIASIPIFILGCIGLVSTIRTINNHNRMYIIYVTLLIVGYILYNLKIPYYSTVKGLFILSGIIPFVYFVIAGIKQYKNLLTIAPYYMMIYSVVLIKNFWILKWWYK